MDADRYLRECGVQPALEYAVNVVVLSGRANPNPIGACASMLGMVRDYDAHFLSSAASRLSGDGGIPGKLRLSGGGWVVWKPSDVARASWAFRLGRSGVAPAAQCSPEHVWHVQETQFNDDAQTFTITEALGALSGDAWPSNVPFAWRLADAHFTRVRGLVRTMQMASADGGCVELPEEEEEEEQQQPESSEEESEGEAEEGGARRRKRQRAGQRRYDRAQRKQRSAAERARAAEARRAEARRARAHEIGAWYVSGYSTFMLMVTISLEWNPCHEHGLVNTFGGMGKALMSWAANKLGAPRLNELAALQSGDKAYSKDKQKFHTGVWLFDSPICHAIYRYSIYFAPCSAKDWAHGKDFIGWVLASGELQPGESWVHEGLMAIRGSRNGIFWANAVAMAIWRQRAIKYLQHVGAVAAANKDKDGGKTAAYLLAVLEEPVYEASLLAMATLYLHLYLPFMAAVTHVADAGDELTQLDQDVYLTLKHAADADAADLDEPDESGRCLFPVRYDRVCPRTRRLRLVVQQLRAGVARSTALLVDEAMAVVLKRAASDFHHYTIERQQHPHEGCDEKEQRRWATHGGSATRLPAERARKLASGEAVTHSVERVFGITRHVHDRKSSLLSTRLSAQARDLGMNASGWMLETMAKLDAEDTARLDAALYDLARRRRAATGGRRGIAERHGKKKLARQEELLARAAEATRKLEVEVERLRALRVSTVAQLLALSSEALLEQLRVFKLVDKVDLKLTGASSKIARLRVLQEQLVAKYGAAAGSCSEEELAHAAGRRASSSKAGAKRKRKVPAKWSGEWTIESVVGAKTVKGVRLYLLSWEGTDDDGNDWEESWHQYDVLLVDDDGGGGKAIHPEIDARIAELDTPTEDEVIEISAVGLEQHEACTCMLAVGDRVLLDSADEGWLAGRVSELAGGMVHVDIDANLRHAGQSDRLIVPRNGDLYKARAQTMLTSGQFVRVCVDEDCAPGEEERWFYGKVTTVHPGGELIDVLLDNGESLPQIPTWEVFPA